MEKPRSSALKPSTTKNPHTAKAPAIRVPALDPIDPEDPYAHASMDLKEIVQCLEWKNEYNRFLGPIHGTAHDKEDCPLRSV